MQVMLRVTGLLTSLAEHVAAESARTFAGRFDELYKDCGGKLAEGESEQNAEPAAIFTRISRICEREAMSVRQYYTRFPFIPDRLVYEGALTGFLDFLTPLAAAVQHIAGLPRVPLFVMLDDADNLPRAMQRVLNSWVSSRSTPAICLKITTQLAYATLRTLDNRIIESPHDFAEVNLSAVYTSEHDNYSDRVRQIVSKRLENSGHPADVYAFFPRHDAQARRISEIEAEIEAEHAARAEHRGVGERHGAARARDERIRYAVPRYMRELAGGSRSAHTFSYAGFKSLVDVSSGVVRWFLEPASRMYDRMASERNAPVDVIPVGVQDEILKEWSTEYVEALSPTSDGGGDEPDLDQLPDVEASLHAIGHETAMYGRLRNLIEGLGRLFRQRLLNEKASEQRVISIVLRDKPGAELKEVLALGVRLGYLQRSDNAAKEALGGRRPRYILARRLGPYFRLDVSGYAAHLSVTSADLALSLDDPTAFVRLRLKDEKAQLSLDFQQANDGN